MSNLEVSKKIIEDYAKGYYLEYTEVAKKLKDELSKICHKVAPQAIVQTRPKSVSSFSEKVFRKSYSDPDKNMTDLCGGRIIVHATAEVEAVVKGIKTQYSENIDYGNSVDNTQRLKSPEFGYRSVHYIIWLRSYQGNKVKHPRVELQIRTLLEHAWADIPHAYAYKSDFPIPDL